MRPDIERIFAFREQKMRELFPAPKPETMAETFRSSAASEPLDSAIEKGFFTPTEILLDGGCDPLANGDALCDAVNRDEPKKAFLRIRSIC